VRPLLPPNPARLGRPLTLIGSGDQPPAQRRGLNAELSRKGDVHIPPESALTSLCPPPAVERFGLVLEAAEMEAWFSYYDKMEAGAINYEAFAASLYPYALDPSPAPPSPPRPPCTRACSTHRRHTNHRPPRRAFFLPFPTKLPPGPPGPASKGGSGSPTVSMPVALR
jgi:hypothetical protein